MNPIHQTLNVLSQAGRVRFDAQEIDALAYALDELASERMALFGLRVEPDNLDTIRAGLRGVTGVKRPKAIKRRKA